ncbi:MAG: 30S ribosomal protein S3 [Planctomycetota bacterium]
MGHKINATGFRVGIYGEHKGWRSRWYAPKKEFGRLLNEDQKIRKYLKAKHASAAISRIDIERVAIGTQKAADGTEHKLYRVVVFAHTARPGVLIGKKGAKLQEIEGKLSAMTGQTINVQIREVRDPELESVLLAEAAAEQLAKRGSFRRTMKNILKQAKDKGAAGCRIRLAGRLGGSEMARREVAHFGSIPLQTLSADVDFGTAVAKTNFGIIGVKVWVYRGLLPGSPNYAAPAAN